MGSPALALVPDAEVLYGLSFDEYRAIDAANLSTLKHLLKSAAHYRHALLDTDEDTDAKKLGRCGHTAILEPEAFKARTALWSEGTRRGKVWDAFRAAHATREILKPPEWDQCLALSAAVRANLQASALLSGGRSEVSIVWTDEETGIRCKARVDYLRPDVIGDLKTCRDASPAGFGKQAWNLGYHVQAAFYQEAVRVAFGDVRPFKFVAAETSAPYVAQVYATPDEVLEIGREQYRQLLRALKEYRERDQWPGYAETELDLELPRWAFGGSDDDLADVGIEWPADAPTES